MKTQDTKTWRNVVISVTVLMALLFPMLSANANVRIVGVGDSFPAYSHLQPGAIFYTDEWAVIVFYRGPDCIPEDFNLFQYFDFAAPTNCQNVTNMDGAVIWKNWPPTDGELPIQFHLHGLGAVPVWFVSWPELEEWINTNGYNLTITDLEAMPRLVGYASFYTETLKNSPLPGRGYLIEFVAKGHLEDGRSFKAQVTSPHGWGAVHVGIDFD